MERSTPVNLSPGEQSLTPGEQRILMLLGQVQLRMAALEKKLDDQGKQSQELAIAQQGLQEDAQARDGRLQRRWDIQHRQTLETLCERIDKLHAAIRERADKQEMSISMLEHMTRRNSEELHRSRTALDALQRELRKVAMDALLQTDFRPDGRAVAVSRPLDVNPPG